MPNSTSPLITIGITAFNAEDTIGRAIDCALAQNWANKEILIVNDCSTDRTASIIETYKSAHPEIRNFRPGQNGGVAAARNILLKEAKGEFIAFFDDDDVSTPDRIEKQYLRILNYGDSDFVVCHTARLQNYPDGSQHIEKTPGSDETLSPPRGREMFERILTGKPTANGFGSMATCSLMIPRKVFEKVGLYDPNFRRSEDTDYSLRFALAGGVFLGISEPLVTQTMTKSSEKTLQDERKFHEMIYAKYAQQLGAAKTDFCLRWLDMKYEFLNGHFGVFIIKLIKLKLSHPILYIQKIFWAFPNIGFNLKAKKFHND